MASVIRGSDNFDSVYAKPKAQCTAWVNFDGNTTPPTIRASYNVSQVVRIGTGLYTVYFTTPMDNIYYSVSGTSGGGTSNEVGEFNQWISSNNKTISNLNIGSVYYVNAFQDNDISVQIFGGKN